jgi:hypothetical protein
LGGASGVTDIGNDELEALLDNGVVIYDVRRPDEWRHTGVIQGSRRLSFVDGRGELLPDFLPWFTAAVPRDQLVCDCPGWVESQLGARGLIRSS